ncbi:MAG TPA: hypothetical protein VNA21_05040, partial [Steroidobacteraceae bacterium]|nr:hypothetical protein [Steroidobacteraceae bacterium]
MTSHGSAELRDQVLKYASVTALLCSAVAFDGEAHGVADDDKAFIERSSGAQLLPFMDLGAKHMVTGYD